jgi:hypothetical protein
MLGTRAVEAVRQHKEALVLESSLNRLKLQAELQNLRSAISPVSGLAGKAQGFFPWLLLLAPAAGFLASRGMGRAGSLGARLVSAVKLVVPLYRWWKHLSSFL